jgi:hypothetical protein
VVETLYLVSYGEEDRYVWDSPKLLTCFSGTGVGGEGSAYAAIPSSLFVSRVVALKVARKIKLCRHAVYSSTYILRPEE